MSRRSIHARIGAAIVIAALAAAHPVVRALTGRSKYSDFNQIWLAAYALVHGLNAYDFVQPHFGWPLFYPLTAAVIGLPFAFFRLAVAGALWVAVSFGLLAFALTTEAWWPLIALASFPALHAVRYGQWSPIITAAAIMPSLAWIALAKPTVGAAVIAAYIDRAWSRRALVASIAVVIVLVSFAFDRRWVAEWRTALAGVEHFRPLVLRPGGLLTLLALLRWRRAEARLMTFLSCVPATAAPYELVPIIALVPRSRLDALILASASYLAVPFLVSPGGDQVRFAAGVAHNAPVLLATTYLPAMLLILSRPNEGDVPAWLERLANHAPEWIRGRRSTVAREPPLVGRPRRSF